MKRDVIHESAMPRRECDRVNAWRNDSASVGDHQIVLDVNAKSIEIGVAPECVPELVLVYVEVPLQSAQCRCGHVLIGTLACSDAVDMAF